MANVNKQRCSRCSRDLSLSTGFYSSTSTVNNETGKLPICKNCLEDRFNELIDKYEGNIKSAFRHLLLNFDIYFHEPLFEEALVNKESLIKTYMTKVNTLVTTKNKTSLDNLLFDKEETEINQELVHKWGENWTSKQYLSLERREQMYLENYPSDSLQEKEIINSLCVYKELEESARACGDDKTVERYSNLISNKMGQLDVIPSKMKNYGESIESTIGNMALVIEREEPVPNKYPEFDDVDGIMNLLIKYFIKPMRRALGITKSDHVYDELGDIEDDDDGYI